MPDSESRLPQGARPGGLRVVLDAVLHTIRDESAATLALVLETEGSTYAKAGAMVYFGADRQIGWLSGGCLEPEIRQRAERVAAAGAFDAMEIDTRDDEDLFSGSAIGCRGRLRLVLIPIQKLVRGDELIEAWSHGGGALAIRMGADGAFEWQLGAMIRNWRLQRVENASDNVLASGEIHLARPARLLLLGAGPETPSLLPQLRALGWFVTLVERRARWLSHAAHADLLLEEAPELAVARLRTGQFDAALIMHHHFELDRQALQALATTDIAFIGLLGPGRRRDDLFKLLPASAIAALTPRLRAPVGLDLGGLGVESITLSIAAQLQSYLHGR